MLQETNEGASTSSEAQLPSSGIEELDRLLGGSIPSRQKVRGRHHLMGAHAARLDRSRNRRASFEVPSLRAVRRGGQLACELWAVKVRRPVVIQDLAQLRALARRGHTVNDR